MQNTLPNNKFHRAIRKYGVCNFVAEQIDSSNSEEELNKLEKFYISKFNSAELGYNMTNGGDGGNTYINRSEEEMQNTKRKISLANTGRNNGMSVQIKCKNVKTNKEYIFDTLSQCLSFLGIKNKAVVTSRARKQCNTLWRNEWMFCYENDDYGEFIEYHYDTSCRKGKKVKLIKDNDVVCFNSINKACNFLNTKINTLVNGMIINGYTVSIDEGVSTIHDECNGVECEISTHSKRKTADRAEDMVSAVGNNR